MSFATRLKKLTDVIYSPTKPASETAIRTQIDDAVQEVYDNVKDVIESVTLGDSGADNVGFNSASVVGTTILEAIEANKADITSQTLGQIPNDSLTEDQHAADMKKIPGGLYPYDSGQANADAIVVNADAISVNAEAILEVEEIRVSTDTTGSSNAYVVDVANKFDFTLDGNVIRINPNHTNTSLATISVNGTTKNIRKFDIDTDAYVVIEAGDIKKNNPTELRYDVSEGFFVLAPKMGQDDNLVAENIKDGVTIFDVLGTYEGEYVTQTYTSLTSTSGNYPFGGSNYPQVSAPSASGYTNVTGFAWSTTADTLDGSFCTIGVPSGNDTHMCDGVSDNWSTTSIAVTGYSSPYTVTVIRKKN